MKTPLHHEEVKQSLFRMYDELSAYWQLAESRLRQYHIPRPVSICYLRDSADTIPPGDECGVEYLGLRKVSGKWCICHCRHPEGDSDTHWTPIRNCSADVRVAAARHFPGLLNAVIQSVENFGSLVAEAIQLLKSELECAQAVPSPVGSSACNHNEL
jgi:hypothetical protein